MALKDEVESQIEQAELPAVRDHAIRGIFPSEPS